MSLHTRARALRTYVAAAYARYIADGERNIDPSQRHRALTAHHLHTYIINAPTLCRAAGSAYHRETNVSIWKKSFPRRTNGQTARRVFANFSTLARAHSQIRKPARRILRRFSRTSALHSLRVRSRFKSSASPVPIAPRRHDL